MLVDNIVEVQIRKVSQLSEAAKREVELKLSQMDDDFNFNGYAKISYARASPLRVIRVDPIEGTIVDYFNKLAEELEHLK